LANSRIRTYGGQSGDLVGGVDDDPPYPGGDRALELRDRLVVAVDTDAVRREAAGERNR
jgi:hypothetical protein